MPTDLLQWAITQGVAVVVLAYVLVRLDGRMVDMVSKLDVIIALLQKPPGSASP